MDTSKDVALHKKQGSHPYLKKKRKKEMYNILWVTFGVSIYNDNRVRGK